MPETIHITCIMFGYLQSIAEVLIELYWMDVHKGITIYHVYIRRLHYGKSLPHVHTSLLSNINA